MKNFKVALVVDRGGDPEQDEIIIKTVSADDKHAAVSAARRLVRHEEREKAERVWAWTVQRVL
jgi:hypothetical protein